MPSNPTVFDGGLEGGPVYIGIDPSYSGFAVTLLSGTSDKYLTSVFKIPGTGIERLDILYDYVGSLCKVEDVEDIAIESPVKMSHAALMMGELYGVTRLSIHRCYALAPLQIPPTSLKKYVAGKGTGVGKNTMLLEVYKKWGVEFNDDNAADSYGLAHMCRGDAELAYEKEVLNKLKDPKFRDYTV